MKRQRKSSGGVLILGLILLGFTIWIFLIFFSLSGFMAEHSRGQDNADLTSLSFAGTINVRDRVGQMNELQSCSRELVFTSRRRLQECIFQEMDMLGPLSDQLLNDALEGHRILEAERKNQIKLICAEVQGLAEKQNDAASRKSGFSLAWLETRAPYITRIDVGRIADVDSNVKRHSAVSELYINDRDSGLGNERSKLFKADINARLPGEDGALDFMISGLPACIDGVPAPARNVNSEVFVRSGTIFQDGKAKEVSLKQIPSAIQITCSMDASIGEKDKHAGKIILVSTGAASGGYAGSDRLR